MITTHLLFVDDVVIFAVGSWVEWQVLSKIFSLFSEASGIVVNMQKSDFLSCTLPLVTLDQICLLLPVAFEELSSWFKYLGYFIKPNTYRL